MLKVPRIQTKQLWALRTLVIQLSGFLGMHGRLPGTHRVLLLLVCLRLTDYLAMVRKTRRFMPRKFSARALIGERSGSSSSTAEN